MSPRPASRTTRLASGISGVVTGAFVGALVLLSGVVLPVGTASADSSSSVTIAASAQDTTISSAPFPDLEVTVSQTSNLVSQGVLVSWTGGRKSQVPSTDNAGTNFLQIMQCWGGDNPDEVDRTTCQYGGFGSVGATRDSVVGSDADVAPEDAAYTQPSPNFAVPTYTSIPFRSVTGTSIESVKDNKKLAVDVNSNEFFTQFTSNEIKWAGSGANGAGSAKFEIQTALQAPGLGCGSPVTATDGTISGRSCWLVVVPRGTADTGEQQNNRPGLFWDNWKHRIAVKLDFTPLGVTCAIGAAERQISGSELVSGAVASWQPALCNSTGGAIYTISSGNEADALVSASGTTGAALALTSRPLATEAGADPLVYAPIALSGIAISFAVDREPKASDTTSAEVAERAGLAFSELRLTPRLVAKLLTNSYLSSLPVGAEKKHLGYVSADDPGHNPQSLGFDPDFLAINDPEWANQSISSPSMADLLLPQGRSDLAWQLWRYVLADPDAAAFLEGTPDPWGMVVNPWSSTTAASNPSGSALVVPRDNFPKADPTEQPGSLTPVTSPVNLVTWRPYTNDFDQSAYLTLRGDGQVLGAWDPAPATGPPKFTKSPRNLVGQQRVLGLTDTASAGKYRVATAQLRNAAGEFVAPTVASLSAAAAAMTATATSPTVYGYDPGGSAAIAAPTAYPLAMPVYAAANPATTDATLRADYAAFVRFAATTGQQPGTSSGQLPDGYAPIPAGWRAQALAAADTIQTGVVTAPAATPTTPATSTALAPGPTGAAVAATPTAQSVAPTASGTATTLLGAATPDDPAGAPLSAAVPASLLSGLAAAGAVPLLSRIRRRS
ncbi:MAG: hypothetical protein H7146_02420 [Burkholderiaceae bacterium]|nr:hypothetical protein [Microbacteriaceae bacterium]